jgi:hypothetical protein
MGGAIWLKANQDTEDSKGKKTSKIEQQNLQCVTTQMATLVSNTPYKQGSGGRS